MKACNRCKRTLDVTDFHKGSRGGTQSICKDCRREIDAAYYKENKARRKGNHKRIKEDLRIWHQELKDKPCVDCNNRYHHAAMHYDHIPGHTKRDDISSMVAYGLGKVTILAEIAKCELVCANCHAVRTFKRMTSNR